MAITKRNLSGNKKTPNWGGFRLPKPNLKGQERESVEEFLARGGRIRRVTPARKGVTEEDILRAVQNILAKERG